MSEQKKPCAQCPWRLANHGKPHKFGFYRKANLRRLWNQIRSGGAEQSCHLTDPSHPDHVAVGAKPGAQAQECPGSVILILREVNRMSDNNVMTPESADAYFASRRKGIKKGTGALYWLISRIKLGGTVMGGPKLPEVDVDDPAI